MFCIPYNPHTGRHSFDHIYSCDTAIYKAIMIPATTAKTPPAFIVVPSLLAEVAEGTAVPVAVAPLAVVPVTVVNLELALEAALLALEDADEAEPAPDEDREPVVDAVAAPVAVIDPLVLEMDMEFVLTELIEVMIANMPE